MILKSRWSPHGFEEYRKRYPQTPWVGVHGFDLTGQFLLHWDSEAPWPQASSIVLTPGLFAEWLPGCFAEVARAARQARHRVLRSSVRTSKGVEEQATALKTEIAQWLGPRDHFVWLAHSKGVLDALWCLREHDSLRARCTGLVAVQPPSGISWVLESWATDPKKLADRAMRRLMDLRIFRAGCREITNRRSAALTSWLETFSPPVPMLQAVSWSVLPTSWVDSFHARLNTLRPGCAHDGQLYLSDQVLPATPTVCLPRLDHAQPVLGGLGLEVGRLWGTLLRVLLEKAQTR